MICKTLHCVGLTQFSVIRIIQVFFYLRNFLLLSLVFVFIDFSQGSVETHLLFGGIYNNHIITNFLQSVHNWQRYGQK